MKTSFLPKSVAPMSTGIATGITGLALLAVTVTGVVVSGEKRGEGQKAKKSEAEKSGIEHQVGCVESDEEVAVWGKDVAERPLLLRRLQRTLFESVEAGGLGKAKGQGN